MNPKLLAVDMAKLATSPLVGNLLGRGVVNQANVV